MSADVWVGFWKDCDCVVGVVVDEPSHPKDTARDVADFIRRGYRVFRYSDDQFRATPWKCPAHPKGVTPPWVAARMKQVPA